MRIKRAVGKWGGEGVMEIIRTEGSATSSVLGSRELGQVIKMGVKK